MNDKPGKPRTVEDINTESPFPWRYLVMGNGQVVVLDATGKEVPLFSILDIAIRGSVVLKGMPL